MFGDALGKIGDSLGGSTIMDMLSKGLGDKMSTLTNLLSGMNINPQDFIDKLPMDKVNAVVHMIQSGNIDGLKSMISGLMGK